MDKQTLSNYGLLTVVTLILAVMLAFATPFGTYVGDGVVSVANSFVGASNKSMDEDNIDKISNKFEQKLEDTLREGIIPAGATYTPSGGTALSGNGTNTFPETPQTGDTYEEGDYVYKYNKYYYAVDDSWTTSTSLNGWGVRVKNTTQTSYGKMLSEIAGKSITTIAFTFQGCTSLINAPVIPSSVTNIYCTFQNCPSLTTAPIIPSGVTDMFCAFQSCYSLTTAPAIPNGVTNMQYTFSGCTKLTAAPTIPSSVTEMEGTFKSCTSLTGTVEINANINTSNSSKYIDCFYGTVKPITLTGSSSALSQLKSTANNGNITIG